MQNILSFDIEDWYHLNYASMKQLAGRFPEGRVVANTQTLLAACAQYEAHATFFFLGSVAEQHPGLVRAAQAAGHEIASHGYGHQLVTQQSRAEFRDDVHRSVDILQNITGEAVRGYRAPSWSISKSIPWAYDVLADLGLTYDASLFPYTTFLYGDSQAPVTPFAHGRKLLVVPATVLVVAGRRLPFSGGFYFRLMPYWAMRLATRLTNRQGRPVGFYLHPREIDPAQPRLPLPPRDYFITYVNLSGTLAKLKRILAMAPTVGIHRFLQASGLMENPPLDPGGMRRYHAG